MLEVHGGLLAWTVITFLILLVVLKKVAWSPIISALETREKEIKDALNAADKAKDNAEKAQKDYEAVVAKAQAEGQEIVAESRKVGAKLKVEIEESARKSAEDIAEKAKEQIVAEKEKALSEIHDIAVELTMKTAEKVVKRNLTTDDNKKFIDDTLNQLGQA